MIPSEILKKVKTLELKTRKAVKSTFAGSYHSVFKGQGLHFSDLRPYYYGDDTRFIDWNVTARTGSPHIKTFEEERELVVILMVDLSASGIFGSEYYAKQEMAAEIAAVLGFSANANNDRVGLLLFSDQTELYIPPKKGKKHMFRLLRDIYYHEQNSHQTNIQVALDQLLSSQKKHAIVFLISDFGDVQYEKSLRLVSQKHDLIPIVIEDPRELSLPKCGLLTLEDPETGEHLFVNTQSKDVQDRFQNMIYARKLEQERIFKSAQVAPLYIKTTDPYIDILAHYFKNRVKK